MSSMHAPVSLNDIFSDLRRARVYLAGGILLGAFCAFMFLLFATPYYRAQMIISPANPMNGAEISSLLADENLFALRHLVQRVGVMNSPDFLKFENTLGGASVAEILLKDENIFKGLAFEGAFGPLKSQQGWSPEKLAEYISKRVRLEPVGATSLRRMVYMHPSPEFAVYFLEQLHRRTDELIRKNLRSETAERVRYLEETINKTPNPEQRRALTMLLMEQERLRMLVSIEKPYAAAMIEPPSASVRPRWPDKALVYVSFILAGALGGFVIHGLRRAR